MSIKIIESVVVEGPVTLEIITEAVCSTWDDDICKRMRSTLTLVDENVYQCEWSDKYNYVCTVTRLAGDYSMLTTFMKLTSGA